MPSEMVVTAEERTNGDHHPLPPAPVPLQDARLWYGIGLLYDCYGSYGYAIEAFNACLKMDPNFELDHEVSVFAVS